MTRARGMIRRIESGWLSGHLIRTARKPHRCDYWHGALNGGRCKTVIQPGDDYAEGELNVDAGGFCHDRYCLSCAGIEAQEAAMPRKAHTQ